MNQRGGADKPHISYNRMMSREIQKCLPGLGLEPKLLRRIGEESEANGTAELTPAQIDKIVKKARAEGKVLWGLVRILQTLTHT
jgi:hypothetical protein